MSPNVILAGRVMAPVSIKIVPAALRSRAGPSITTQALKTFARTARKRMRTENGGCRRDHLRALAQRVEVDQKELRIMGSKSVLLRTLVAASSAKTAGFGVPSSAPHPARFELTTFAFGAI